MFKGVGGGGVKIKGGGIFALGHLDTWTLGLRKTSITHKTYYFAKIIDALETGTPQGQFLKNNFLTTLPNHNPINNIC